MLRRVIIQLKVNSQLLMRLPLAITTKTNRKILRLNVSHVSVLLLLYHLIYFINMIVKPIKTSPALNRKSSNNSLPSSPTMSSTTGVFS